MRNRIRFLLPLILLTGCTSTPTAPPAAAPPGSATPSTAPPTVTPTPSPTPRPAVEVAYHRLRIEYALTSDWGSLDIVGLEQALGILSVEKTGTAVESVNLAHLALDRPVSAMIAEPEVRLVVDVALSPTSDGTLTLTSRHGASHGSVIRLYLLDASGEPFLLEWYDHRWVDSSNPDTSEVRFTVDLTPLADREPIVALVPRDGIERLVWAVYYPWYMPQFQPRWWESDIWVDRPSLAFASDDPEGLRAHMAAAQSAGIDGFLVEWCGTRYPGDSDLIDANFGTMLDLAAGMGFKLAAYYDLLCTQGFVPEDLEYLLEVRAAHPAYYRMNGRAVVVMYNTAVLEPAALAAAQADLDRRGLEALFVGESYNPEAFLYFEGLHQYVNFDLPDLEGAYDRLRQAALIRSATGTEERPRFWAATVSPGFDNTPLYRARGLLAPEAMGEQDLILVDRAGGQTYREAWEAALRSDADWVIISTWNEWQENTHIEPSLLYGEQYLDLTREYVDRMR